jgi:hypothetical protein
MERILLVPIVYLGHLIGTILGRIAYIFVVLTSKSFIKKVVTCAALLLLIVAASSYVIHQYRTPVNQEIDTKLNNIEVSVQESVTAAKTAVVESQKATEGIKTLDEQVAEHRVALQADMMSLRSEMDIFEHKLQEDREKIGIGKTVLMISLAKKEAVWAAVDAALERSQPELILSIALQESPDLNPKARGDGGKAWGMFQIHRYCWDGFLAKQYGKKPTAADYADPKISARFAEHIMESLYVHANGDVRLALRMYNGGVSGWNSPKTARYADNIMKNVALLKKERELAKTKQG